MARSISMLSTVSNDCPGGWNPACYDLPGSYSITAATAYNLIVNQGWAGDNAWYALAIVYLESSFVPDVIAYCPAGSCQPIEVHAIGLFQIYWEVHQNYDYEKLKQPAYNIAAAWDLYQLSGWGPWPHDAATVAATIPLVAQMVRDSQSSLPPQAGGLVIPPEAEPHVQPPADIPEAPQAPTITPPSDNIPRDYPHDPAGPDYGRWGWEAIDRYFRNDLVYYTGYDQYLVQLLDRLPGSAG